MKINIGDLVARDMLGVLNSKEHAQLFKKAYKMDDHGKSCSSCGNACNDMGDCDMCGDGNMAEDNMTEDHDMSWSEDQNMMHDMMSDSDGDDSMDDFDIYDETGDEFMGDSLGGDKLAMAINSALQDLITASAALDYADNGKASELAIKLAALVSKDSKKSSGKGKTSAKGKKKVPAKGKKPAFLMGKEKAKSSTSSKSSASSKSSKKMTMKEKMEALRAKKK